MSRHRITIAALVAVAAVGGALACGPDFPWQLLDDRHATMTEPVAFGFSFDATRLVAPPQDRLRAAEQLDSSYMPPPEPEIIVIERHEAESGAWQTLATDLPAGARTAELFLPRLQAARAATDGPAALAAGAGLPSAVVGYIAGAVEFHAERYDQAASYFDAIDALPPEQRTIRQVAAAYMKGRIHQLQGEAEAARAAFRAARADAEAGAPDPMGLAVASFGEEARVDLIEAGLITPRPGRSRSWTTRRKHRPSSAMPYGSMPSRPRANRRSPCCRCARWRPCWSPMPTCWPGRSKIRWCGGCSSPTPSRAKGRGTRRAARSSARA